MVAELGSKSWYRQDEKTYRKGQYTLVRNGKGFPRGWSCRFDGKEFARAKTLAEAKKNCE